MTPQGHDHNNTGDEFTHDDPIVDEALDWFVRLRNTTPDPATKDEFDRWLSASSEHERQYRDIEDMWGTSAFGKAVKSLHMPLAAVQRPKRGVPHWITNRMTAAAAAALIAVGIWQYPALILRWQADYITATGQQSTVTLPDGSTMMLDTASAVAIDFTSGKRDIRLLQGEAFFDVKPDAAHPFRVAAQFGEVTVLGTAFSVRSDDETDRVVLERGHVSVNRVGNQTETADLRPNEMIFASAGALSGVSVVDPSTTLAWRDNRIAFESQTFSHVLNELERYYRGKVIVVDSRHDQLTVTGNYRLDDIEAAIRTLADSVNVTMTRLPGGVIILR